MTVPTFTFAAKLAEIDREIKMRRHVYPKWIAAGRLSQAKADEQIAIMEAIAADYREKTQGERLL